MAVGYDNIDIAAANRRCIVVSNTPGVLTETTADLAFALLMAAARRVVEADRHTRQGRWKTWGPQIMLGHDIHHSTLGIIGLGRIGAEVARRAKGFSMRVLYYDKVRLSVKAEKELGVEYIPDLRKLLPLCDFISLHVPLSPETCHLLGVSEFALMKPTAVLINTSRGSIIDRKALYTALKSRQIFAAGIDVTEIEPIPADDPLLALDNVIITPHIASASFATRRQMALMAVENLLDGLKGKIPPHCVNPEALNK
jgi:glyoxylate reductase